MYQNKKYPKAIQNRSKSTCTEWRNRKKECPLFFKKKLNVKNGWFFSNLWRNLQENQKEGCELWEWDILETETAIWNRSQILQYMTPLSSSFTHSPQQQYTQFKQSKSLLVQLSLHTITMYLLLQTTLVLPIQTYNLKDAPMCNVVHHSHN